MCTIHGLAFFFFLILLLLFNEYFTTSELKSLRSICRGIYGLCRYSHGTYIFEEISKIAIFSSQNTIKNNSLLSY